MKTKKNNLSRKISKLILSLMVILSLASISNAQPREDWISRYNKLDQDDKPMAMTAGNDGFIYVTGYSVGKSGDKDFLTVKYAPTGKEVWTATFEGPGNADGSDDIANAIAVDGKGNVFVTGSTHGGFRGRDFCTVKYDRNGTQIWVNYYSGTGRIDNSDEEAVGIALDNSSSVLVTGSTDEMGTSLDFCTVKYSNDGATLWAQTFDGQGRAEDIVKSVKVDSKDNVIISGSSKGLISDLDYLTVKYDASGNELWHAVYHGPGGNITINTDEVSAMILDRENNIYVTGYGWNAATAKDFLTVKYDSEGEEQWVSRVDNVSTTREEGRVNEDVANAIALDGSGNIYLTGKTVLSEGGSAYFTCKLNGKGQLIWGKKYSSDDYYMSDDEANAIAVDQRGNVYVTGYTNGFSFGMSCGSSREFTTVKYSASGELRWEKNYDGSGRLENSDDIARAISLDSKGGIYVMGESKGEGTELDYCLIRYDEFTKREESAAKSGEFSLNDNFPNPFNPSTQISFNVPVASNVRLAIYDISGREVALLVNNVLSQGNHKYEWNASQFSSGTYFYRIQAEGFTKTKKMLLVK